MLIAESGPMSIGNCVLILTFLSVVSSVSFAQTRYDDLLSNVETKLTSDNIEAFSKVPTTIARLQRICFSEFGASDDRCFPHDLMDRYNTRRIELARDHDGCSDHLDAVEKRRIIIGTSAECALLTLGYPDKINTTETADTIREQWVYGTDRYVYVKGGIVEAEQR